MFPPELSGPGAVLSLLAAAGTDWWQLVSIRNQGVEFKSRARAASQWASMVSLYFSVFDGRVESVLLT